MPELFDAEADLSSALRRLEPHTPFAEALGERISGSAVRLDRTTTSLSSAPRLAGAALRAWGGDRWIDVGASDLSRPALDRAVAALVARLDARPHGAPAPGEPTTGTADRLDRPSRPLDALSTDERLSRVRDWFRWATSVPGVENAIVLLGSSVRESLYLNTAGARRRQRLERVRALVNPIAMEGGKVEHDLLVRGAVGGQELLAPFTEENVRASASGARALLSAGTPPSGSMNVLLDPSTTGTFAHESFGHGTEADQFVRDRSYLQPILGSVVAPDLVTIGDDPSVPGAHGSYAFDDEGRATSPTVLVDRGRFTGVLHDRTSGALLGSRSTGNARRANFLSREFVRMSNTFVAPGTWTFDELVKEARDGVVLEHCTSGMEDPLGGQMQMKVNRGRLIEHGRVTKLVSSIALSGRVLDVLKEVRGVGKAADFEFRAGTCGKGHGDYLPVSTGGSYLLTRAVVGPG